MWTGVRCFRILVFAAVGLATLPVRGVTADEEWPDIQTGLRWALSNVDADDDEINKKVHKRYDIQLDDG